MSSTMYDLVIVPKLEEIRRDLRSGLGEATVARQIGVSPRSWRRYRKEHPDFAAMIREAAAAVNDEVEAALLRRATGFENADGKTVPPDVRAAVFWLKNRRPRRWRDRAELAVNTPMPVQLFPEEENL